MLVANGGLIGRKGARREERDTRRDRDSSPILMVNGKPRRREGAVPGQQQGQEGPEAEEGPTQEMSRDVKDAAPKQQIIRGIENLPIKDRLLCQGQPSAREATGQWLDAAHAA